MVFSMGVLVYGFEVGVFFYVGFLLVASCGSYYGSLGEFRVEVQVVMVMGLRVA